MKTIARNILINALSLFFLTVIFSGVKISGGIITYVLGGFVLSILFNILKPFLNILSLPLNIMTMGTFSFFLNVLIFYLATQIITGISIKGFVYPGASLGGFVIPQITFNTFFAYLAAALLQSIFVSLLTWIRK